jgi:hypothetical protein
MLGAIGATCAFPFDGDELYGQHVHATLVQTSPSSRHAPAFFTPAEYSTLSRLADVIIPPTDTPGAAAAGVPEYIDRVVTLNKEHQPLMRAGLAWLERQAQTRFSRDFSSLGEAEHIAMLQPLSDEIDRQRHETRRQRFRRDAPGKEIYFVAVTDRDVQARPATPTAAASEADADLPLRFFRLVKNLTADGYYTSRVGLLEELGYAGNRALAQFPACAVPEH